MELNISWPCSQKPATCLYLEPNRASQHLTILFTAYFDIIRIYTSRLILSILHISNRIPVRARFSTMSRPAPWTTQPPIKRVPVLSRGLKRLGRDVDHSPPSIAEVKVRVELFLYSTSGPSWPVLGYTLPLPL